MTAFVQAAALVLAGARPDDPIAQSAGVSHKALVPVDGVPMIIRVLTALRAARKQAPIGRILISTDRSDLLDLLAERGFDVGDVELLQAGDSPSVSVAQAMEVLGTPLLVTTADHALLEPEWIAYFMSHVPAGADIAAALASADLVKAEAPHTQRTYLRFRDGAFSGCNLFYLETDRARSVISFWRQAEALRKQPWRLARLLGFGAALRYGLGILSRADALARLGQICQAKAAFVDMPFGRCAIDVDKPADLLLVEELLARK